MHQPALLQARQIAPNAGWRCIEQQRQLIHRAISVTQQNLEDLFRAFVRFCRHGLLLYSG
jgi:hypothetical protein